MPAEAYISSNAWDEVQEMLWVLWNRDMRNVVIKEGGIKIMNGGALVGTVGMIGETVGLGYQYDGAVTSAAAVAAIHKANLAAHTTDLASQLASINYLNEQKNLHAATLAAHGSELSSQAGSIGYLAGITTGHSGAISSLQSAVSGLQSGLNGLEGSLGSLQSEVGGLSGVGAALHALGADLAFLQGKVQHIENYLSGGSTGPFNPGS